MKRIVLTIVMQLTLLIPIAGALPATAYAACGSGAAQAAKDQVIQGVGETGGSCSETPITNVIAAAVNILSLVVGMAAIIAIILAGFKYITSAGDSNKVSGAKQTLIYALVGLVVAALAQIIVHFVLFHINKAVTS